MSGGAQQKGVRHKGWLHKRGGRIHTWHRRWFVLTGDLLFYYKSPQDSRATGTIPLAGNRVIRQPDDPKQPASFKFEIVSGGAGQVITGNHESYLISAESAEAADGWVTAIRRVIHEPYGGGMFGRSLEETMRVEARLGGVYVPVLLDRCVKFIREHGLREVGIFRLPGQASQIQSMKELYDSGSQQDLTSTEDVHTVASLLKLYLRELPEPVVPYIYYDSYKQALEVYFTKVVEGSSECQSSEGVEMLKRLLIQLPQANFNVLKYLCRFLHEVESYSNDNKMNVMNLGTIFGPHLLSPQTDDPQFLMESNGISADFVRAMVAHLVDFFPPTSDETVPRRLSVVFQPGNTPPWVKLDRATEKDSKMGVQRSLYQPKTHLRKFRDRQYTAPTGRKVHSGQKWRGRKGKGVKLEDGSVESGHVQITGPILLNHTSLSHSGLESLHRSSSDSTHSQKSKQESPQSTDKDKELNEGPWKTSPLFASSNSSDDDDVPEILKRLSRNGVPTGKQLTDTMSSDAIVNSISTELETLEWQLSMCREEATHYKKASHLWKTRYEAEYRARLAAEHRVHDLQNLIDETFQQFALDDSEDEPVEDEISPTVPDLADLQNGGSQPLLDLSLDSTLAALKPYSSTPTLNKYFSSCELTHRGNT